MTDLIATDADETARLILMGDYGIDERGFFLRLNAESAKPVSAAAAYVLLCRYRGMGPFTPPTHDLDTGRRF